MVTEEVIAAESPVAGAPLGQKSDVVREVPADQDPAEKALVKEWLTKISEAETYWETDFKRMREDMDWAFWGAPKTWINEDKYVVPIVGRHINQAVARLYAKDPKAIIEPKQRMDYTVWDGREDTLKAAMTSIANAVAMGGMPDEQSMAILQDVSQAQEKRTMLKKVCKTASIVLKHFLVEQQPSFKKQLKQMVRRVKTCGVAYIFVGYQRILEQLPDIQKKIDDVSSQIAEMERLAADVEDGKIDEENSELAVLRSMQEDLKTQVEVIVREGPVFDFPRATEIIHDPECQQLDGMIGSGWYARKMFMPVKEIQKTFKKDVSGQFTSYDKTKAKSGRAIWTANAKADPNKEGFACLYNVWNKVSGQTFWVCAGYPDFIKRPEAPKYRVEGFWQLIPIVFNAVEHEDQLFPLSDAYMLRNPQMEYNRSREMRRMHRKASTPMYVSVDGRLTESDEKKLQNRLPFSIIKLKSLLQNEKIDQLIQLFKPAPMDPAMYETNSEMEDIYRTVGSQEANIGGTGGATATEVSEASQSQSTAAESNTDDLNELLTHTVRITLQLMLMAMNIQTVKRIAGEGAAWPQMNRSAIYEELFADIQAGSSGRPNAAAELAKMERGMPIIMQMSGMNMAPFGEKYANLLDIDVEEARIEGLPSQTALNAMASKMAQQAAMSPAISNDPTQQGAQGGNNAPAADQVAGGPQPAYPAPTSNAA